MLDCSRVQATQPKLGARKLDCNQRQTVGSRPASIQTLGTAANHSTAASKQAGIQQPRSRESQGVPYRGRCWGRRRARARAPCRRPAAPFTPTQLPVLGFGLWGSRRIRGDGGGERQASLAWASARRWLAGWSEEGKWLTLY